MIYYLLPFVLLFVSTYTFHTLWIRFYPRSKSFWIKVDYVWVSLGFIGVIGATYSLKKEVSVIVSPWHQQTINSYYKLYKNDLQWQINYYLNSNIDYDNFKDRRRANDFIYAGNFFKSLASKANQYENYILTEKRYNFLDSLDNTYKYFIFNVDNSYIKDNSAGLVNSMSTMKNEADLVNKLKSNSERNGFDWILLFLSPFFLSIAIALRLTKVTAQLAELKNK